MSDLSNAIGCAMLEHGHLIRSGEEIDFNEFATRILLNADVRNPKVSRTIEALESEIGMIQKDNQGELHWQYLEGFKELVC